MAGPDPDKQTYTYKELLPYFNEMQRLEKELRKAKELIEELEDQVHGQKITIESLESELRTYQ